MSTRSFALRRIVLFVLACALFVPAAFGQMPQPDTSQLLSSSEVGQEQIQKVARIAVAVRKATQPDQMKLRKDMQKKYPNPQQMDSTEKVKARKEVRRRQMQVQKKRMKIMQQQANEEGMGPQMFQRIIRSAQRDSTLGKRLQSAVKEEMKNQGMPIPTPPGQPNQ